MYKHFEDNAESQQLNEAQSNKIAELKKKYNLLCDTKFLSYVTTAKD